MSFLVEAPFGSVGRNLFGPGCLQKLPAELAQLKLSKVGLVGSGSPRSVAQLELVEGALAALHTHTWAGAREYIYPEAIAAGEAALRDAGVDCVVTVGGGGPIGHGKLLAWRLGVPLVTVVTTYSGSECTAIQSMIEDGAKTMYSAREMLASVRIYDPELTMGLPTRLSVTSGMNALAHAMSCIYNPSSNRYQLMVAGEAVRSMSTSLQRIHTGAKGAAAVEARTDALYGAWLCGTCIGGIGIQHKFAHIFGGSFGAPHAESHTVALPHSVGYNEAAAPPERNTLAAVALGGAAGDSPSALMHALQLSLDAPTSLEEIGLNASDLSAMRDEIMEGRISHANLYEAYGEERVDAALQDMWHGRTPVVRPSAALAPAAVAAAMQQGGGASAI
jgi:maleylacetate reductase